jgi:uncharacterized membrane protein
MIHDLQLVDSESLPSWVYIIFGVGACILILLIVVVIFVVMKLKSKGNLIV